MTDPDHQESADPAPDSAILADGAREWASAYVHIPFCARVCPYCDFAVVAGREDMVDRYTDAVTAEIAREEPWRKLDSVYVGGGTPSRVDPFNIGRLLSALRRQFDFNPGIEVSLEANPEDWTPALAEGLSGLGFNRVSFGAQSFSSAVLSGLGRRHDASQIGEAVLMAREAGFSSINLDLIFGTPGESLSVWEATMEAALAIDPDHLSCYALTVERGTELARNIAAGATAPDPDHQADEYEMACEILARTDLVRYEVSNWAKPGHTVRYNMVVWARGEYLAFGMGAHRFREAIRSHNHRRLEAYLHAIESGISAQTGAEHLIGWEADVERVFLGIRRAAGVEPGSAGRALIASDNGRRLLEAGVIGLLEDRVVVLRPLLTDAVARAVLALTPP